MRANRKRDTRPELLLRSHLHRLGLRFRTQLRIECGEIAVRPDVIFTRSRLAVFVDGCFWHRCPEHGNLPRSNSAYWRPKLERNVSRDALVSSALLGAGWKVVRVWEHENPKDAAERIEKIVRGRGGVMPARLKVGDQLPWRVEG